MQKARNLQGIPAKCALYLRSVCVASTAFRGLRCHPLTCIVLKLRLSVDLIPSALTILTSIHAALVRIALGDVLSTNSVSALCQQFLREPTVGVSMFPTTVRMYRRRSRSSQLLRAGRSGNSRNRGWASESVCKSLSATDAGSAAQPVHVSRPQPLGRCLRQS